MKTELSRDELDLYKRIDEILFYKWDPIGISESYWARDEYQSYLPQIYKIALENKEPEAIAAYLGDITTNNMGLSERKDHDISISNLILEIKEGIGL